MPNDLVWDDSLNISKEAADKFLGESEAVQEARKQILQGLQVDPTLFNGQTVLGGAARSERELEMFNRLRR